MRLLASHVGIASASVAINRQGIPNKNANNPQKKRAQSYGEATAQPRFGFHNL
ncbi:MAG: hypothetical protein K2F85_02820 [Helicobacter sp.]|nr:hypothetical protein [Helicobacter sp.]